MGRVGIIEGVRDVLRSGKCLDISRKSLASHIGVTPALITYYFPKRESLMEAVVVPVIKDYCVRLRHMVEIELALEDRLRKIIGLFAELHGKDATILAIYRSLEEAAPEDAVELANMTSILSDFFFDWHGDDQTRSFDAAVLQGAVRGMCEFAKRSRADRVEAASNRDANSEPDWLEPLLRMLTVGRGLPSGPSRSMMAAAI